MEALNFKRLHGGNDFDNIENTILFEYSRYYTCISSLFLFIHGVKFRYSETLNKEYIERIHQMSYSSLSDNGMLQIFSFLIK